MAHLNTFWMALRGRGGAEAVHQHCWIALNAYYLIGIVVWPVVADSQHYCHCCDAHFGLKHHGLIAGGADAYLERYADYY